MKRTICIAAALIMTIALPVTVFAAEGNVITRTFEFLSPTIDFNYTGAPSQVVEGIHTYYIATDTDAITYELIEAVPVVRTEQRPVTQSVGKSGMSSRDESAFDESMEYEEEGFAGILHRTRVDFTERSVNGGSPQRAFTFTSEVDYGYQVTTPEPQPSRRFAYTHPTTGREETAMFECVSLDMPVDWQWMAGHTAACNVPAHLADIQHGEAFNTANEISLLNLMKLSPESYRITGGRWTGNAQDGSRMAEFDVMRYVARFVAVYEAEILAEGASETRTVYDATATYEGVLFMDVTEGEEYRVNAIVRYEMPVVATPVPTMEPATEPTPEPTPEPVEAATVPFFETTMGMVVAVATPITLFCLAGFVFFLRKRKKTDDGGNGDGIIQG